MASPATPCPMCKNVSIKEEELDDVNYKDYRVKTANGWITFEEATEGYVRTYFPSWERSTYKVPRMFSYDHRVHRLNFKLDNELSEAEREVQIHRQQRDAVEKVAQAICRWGKEKSEAMFVVSEMNFRNFLRHVELNPTRAGSSRIERKDVQVYSGDHDILVISMSRGVVIFVQVKSVTEDSVTKTRSTQLTKAMEQLAKDEKAIKSMNRDLSFVQGMRIIGLPAVPNLKKKHLDEVFVCSEHQSITLTASVMETDGTFCEWWEGHLEGCPQRNPPGMSGDEYLKLSGRYVGLASAMKYRTLQQAITKSGNKIHYRGLIPPTPEQKVILDDEGAESRKKVICGDFGTGKSLLLMKKAEELAERDIVYVVSMSVVSDGSGKVQDEFDKCVDHLKGMIHNTSGESPNLKVTSFLDQLRAVGSQRLEYSGRKLSFPFQLTPDILTEVMENTRKQHGDSDNVHFFLDEIPLSIGSCENEWKEFETFCSNHPNMHVWVAISCCSYALTNGEDYPSLRDTLPSSFSVSSLKRCMRMTRRGFNLVRAVRKFKRDGHYDLTECDNVIDGPEPKWLVLGPCQCTRKPTPYQCECIGSVRLGKAIDRIWEELRGIDPRDVSIILHDTTSNMNEFLTRIAREACEASPRDYEFRVSRRQDGVLRGGHNDKRGITVVDFWSYKGNESKVVIYVDPYGGPIVWNIESRWTGYQDVAGTLSRSIAQIFYITWPTEEQEYFLDLLPEEMEACAEKEVLTREKDFKVSVARAIRNGRTGKDGRRFMEYFVSEGVIARMGL